MEDLAAEVAAHRLVLDRMLGHVPEEVLRDWASRAAIHAEFVAGGGQTIPPPSPAEKRGASIARDIIADALNQKVSLSSTEEGFV